MWSSPHFCDVFSELEQGAPIQLSLTKCLYRPTAYDPTPNPSILCIYNEGVKDTGPTEQVSMIIVVFASAYARTVACNRVSLAEDMRRGYIVSAAMTTCRQPAYCHKVNWN